jgi:hypothetical protein
MRIGVPLIAPRELGAVGPLCGRPWLPSVHLDFYYALFGAQLALYTFFIHHVS